MQFVLVALFIVATSAAWMTLVVLVARRLSGLRIGLARTLLGGLVGLAAFSTFGYAVQIGNDGNQWAFATIQVSLSVMATTAFLVIAEALVPQGSALGFLTWRRALRNRARRTRRYMEISSIAMRHGLVPVTRRRRRVFAEGPDTARSLRLALEEAGVTFVKLGQLLSTRRDLLPPEFIDELSKLQESAPPEPWTHVQAVLHVELGASWRDLFAHVDPEPLASASIAQVHAAVLASGESVVVKVQRSGIRELIDRDMDVVARIARSLEQRAAWARRMGASDLARGFARALHEELDFRIEARNMVGVATAATRRGDHSVSVPELWEQLCTQRVLVMERFEGVSLGADSRQLDALEVDRGALAQALLRWLLAEIVLDGVFHADPHPGNILVLPDGRLGLLDFGSVGRLDPATQAALQQLLAALDRNDPAGARDALIDVVASNIDVDERRLERALGQFMVQHLGPAARPDSEMFTDLFRLVADHGLAVPPDVAAVFRSLATLEGTLAHIAPGFAILDETRQYAKAVVAEQLDPGSLRQAASDELTALLPVLRPLPRRVARLTTALERGDLSLRMRVFADERDRRFVASLVQQILLAFLGATTGITAALLLGTTGGPQVTDTVTLLDLIGYNLLLVSAVLVLRGLFTSVRDH